MKLFFFAKGKLGGGGVACVAGIKAGGGRGRVGKGRRDSKGEGIGERRKGSHAEKHAPNSDWSLK